MDDINCNGTERKLQDCRFSINHNCQHLEDAGVRCQGKGIMVDNAILFMY